MKPPANAIQTVGDGPDVLLVHGTAADRTSCNILVPLLRDRFRVTSYDRRGTHGWPLGADAEPVSIEQHAVDAADVIQDRAAGSAFIFGVSLGGVIGVELMRRRPDLVRGAVLFEPPLIPPDGPVGFRNPFLLEFERLVNAGRGEEAAESFQRRLLSDALWERLPAEMQEAARKNWRHVYSELVANADYRPHRDELANIDIPVVLAGGRPRSPVESSLRALAAALPRSRRVAISAVAHRLDVQGWRELAAALIELA